ncbi:hypothetical protein Barb6XT_02990 [Bacteroidales bacterium Barb6XT]|nr:hypothetical protein Barb6XT_02990 [Bacteroidales bacterium Barb6XT]
MVLLVLDIALTIVFTLLEAKEYVEEVKPYDIERPGKLTSEGEASGTLFGLDLTSYFTLNHDYYYRCKRDEHHYAIRKASPNRDFNPAAYKELSSDSEREYERFEVQKAQGNKKLLDQLFVNPRFTNREVFNTIFMIDKEAFNGTKGMSGGLRMPPNLNYINDYAFTDSDIDSMDFTGGDKIAIIGSAAFSGTKLRTIDLSEHYGLSSVGRNCFSNNPYLSTVKLPGTVIALGIDAFDNTSALKAVEIGWGDRWQLEAVEYNLSDSYPSSSVQRLFKGKDLVIPSGSFEQYYRHSLNGKYMGGNFMIAENHPVLTVVEAGNSGIFYLTKDEVAKGAIDSEETDEETRKILKVLQFLLLTIY